MGLPETPQDLRHPLMALRPGEPDRQRTITGLTDPARLPHGVIGRVENADRAFLERLSRRRQPYAPAIPVKEGRADNPARSLCKRALSRTGQTGHVAPRSPDR